MMRKIVVETTRNINLYENLPNLSLNDIELIGEITRRNKTIDESTIKNVLNLNAPAHEIRDAKQLFPWNNNEDEAEELAIKSISSQSSVSVVKMPKQKKHSFELTDQFVKNSLKLSDYPTTFALKLFKSLFTENDFKRALEKFRNRENFRKTKQIDYLDENKLAYIKDLVFEHFEAVSKPIWCKCEKAFGKVLHRFEERQKVLTAQRSSNNGNVDEVGGVDEDDAAVERGDGEECTNADDDIEAINTDKANENLIRNSKCSLNLTDGYFVLDERHNLNLLTDKEIMFLKKSTVSPMVFSTKVLLRVFTVDELVDRCVSGRVYHSEEMPKRQIEESRLMYIKWLVEKHFQHELARTPDLWKRCCKEINRAARKCEQKLDKSRVSE